MSTATTELEQHEVRRRWMGLGAVTLASLMIVLDASVVNIALPSMQTDLHLGDSARSRAVTGYAVAFGGLLLLGGRMADQLGRKRALLLALVGFTLASVTAGLATGAATMIASRAAQGAFAALLAPAALVLVAGTFDDGARRARAFSIYAATQGSGGGIGLLLGGTVTGALGWRWVFFINLPLALLALAVGIPTIRESRGSGHGGFDLPGALLATIGATALVLAVDLLSAAPGRPSAGTLLVLVLAVVVLVGFVLHERGAAAPLLPLRVLAERRRAGAYLVAACVMGGLSGMFVLLPFYFRGRLGYQPLGMGLAILPFNISMITASLRGPALVVRWGQRRSLVGGAALATVGMALMTTVHGGRALVGGTLPSLVMIGAGMGVAFSLLANRAVQGVRPEDMGVAGAMLNVSQQLGSALGVALLNGVFVARSGGAGTSIPALRVALLVGALFFAGATVAAALSTRDRRLHAAARHEGEPALAG